LRERDLIYESVPRAKRSFGNPAMTMVLQCLAGGLLIGGVYSLIAIGLTIIYGVLKIVNFAHGEFLMLAMFAAFFGYRIWGVDPYLMAVLTIPLFFLLGVVIQKFLIQPTMEGGDEHIQILLTMGLAWIMQNVILFFFGPDYRALTLPYTDTTVKLAGIYLSVPKIIACGGAILTTLGIHLLFKKTRLGKSIRAAAQEPWGAYLVGINVKQIYYLSFAIGITCVSIAGFLIIPFFYTAPVVGAQFTLIAFVVVVLGGLGSFTGALVGGFIVGLVEALGGALLPGSYQELIVFSFFIVVLLFKPLGLFVRAHE
jgi:branched-chain amino acid transport system permease protein